MKRSFQKACRVLAILCFVAVAAHLACTQLGCATDQVTGKTRFDPQQAQAVLASPPIQSVAHSIPFGLGDLAVAGVGAALYYLSNKNSASQTVADVAKHAITAATSAAASSIGKDAPVADVVAPAAGSGPTPPSPAKT